MACSRRSYRKIISTAQTGDQSAFQTLERRLQIETYLAANRGQCLWVRAACAASRPRHRHHSVGQSGGLGGFESRAAWQQTVQDHLQENFGLRERNLFPNVVLIQPLSIDGSFNQEHNRKRSLVAQQLEKIGDTIIRYSDLAAKRRAENS